MAFDLKKMFSTVFILVGLYYFLVGLRIINAKIIWLSNYIPNPKTIVIVGIVMAMIGLLLNDKLRKKLF